MNHNLKHLRSINRVSTSKRTSRRSLPGRLRAIDVLEMTKSIGVLLNARLTLEQALTSIMNQSKSPVMKSTVMELLDNLKKGQSFSEALRKHKDRFEPYYIQMVVAGEESAKLDITFTELTKHYERILQFRQQLKLALIYPTIMLVVASITLFIFSQFIVPNIISTYSEFNSHPPDIALLMVNVVNIMPYVVIACALFFLTLALIYRSNRFRSLKRWVERISLSAPMLGVFLRKTHTAHFSRTMSMLISNGQSVSKSLEISASVVKSIWVQEQLLQASKKLQRGKSLGECLDASGIFPEMAVMLLNAGEQAADLSGVFQYIAEHYEQEIESFTDILGNLLEPVFIILFGLIVGVIIITLYIPLLSLVTVIQY